MTGRPGLEEAVKVISSPKYTTSTAERVVAELTIRTIYPLIAAAVRADERQRVLAEVDAAIVAERDNLIEGRVRLGVNAARLAVHALDEATR